ncbi:MAG: proline--tRNA ligase [Planctomycetes bacterium]|nr:proline--tRNA ligase [Planctomycetota bacterium]
MRWTRTFIPTLREAPSDAESPSHRLLIRAGMIRPLAAGSYSYLPLGYRTLRKAEEIVRQEMDRSGAIELFMPSLHPPELWQETGRYELFGDTLMKVKDRKGALNVLGHTHEEVITHIVRNEVKSYRQLPLTLYQIQGKFRDEARPRHGIIRTREFIMKDAYSFDLDEKAMGRSYQAMYDAYVRIYGRAELKFLPVEADTGLMGGDVSHEFMAVSPYGEDSVVTCGKCSYAANKEKAECPPDRGGASGEDTKEILPVQEVATPDAHTIEQVSAFLQVPPRQLLKTLIYKAGPDFIAALVRGDHEVNESKLRRAAQAETLEMATPEEIQRATGGPVGFSGPLGLSFRIFADYAAVQVCNSVAGANKRDAHLLNINVNRDYRPERVGDFRMAVTGDACPRCGGALGFTHGIEVGNVFKLGTRYSKKMNCVYLDDKAQLHPMVMGCYGIGVNRIVAAAVENHHDDAGILWPRELAPYQVEIVSLDHKKMQIVETAHDLHDRLEKAGVEVLWDDRDQAPGVKFADADLIGLPVRITVGKRTLEAGTVDVRTRKNKDQKSVTLEQVVETVKHELSEYRL